MSEHNWQHDWELTRFCTLCLMAYAQWDHGGCAGHPSDRDLVRVASNLLRGVSTK